MRPKGRLLKAARDLGIAEEDLDGFGMAVREAMVNAVVHGNRYNTNKKVRLRVLDTPDGVKVEITDEGDGFEPDDVPDPLKEENLLQQSGRGLLLIQAFVDEFSVVAREAARHESDASQEAHRLIASSKN